MKLPSPIFSLCSLSVAVLLLTSACNQSTQSTTSLTQTPETALGQTTTPSNTASKTEWKAATPTTSVQAAPQTNDYLTYKPDAMVSGYLRSIGSDSMDKVMQFWEAEFGTTQRALRFRHEGKGSSTAIPALLERRADFGPMSRKVKPAEVERFVEKFGYAPTQLPVAIDSLAIYLHPSNPLSQSGLSIGQLKAIFGSAKALNNGTPITQWGQLGLTGEWANAPIRLHGRNPASGTFAFFNSKILSKANFSDTLQQHAGSAGVVDAVAADPYAIGYSGIAYLNDSVRAAPLKAAGNAITANKDNAVSGRYPLTRELYITLNLAPKGSASELQKEFMRFAYSKSGQAIVSKVGYFPVDPTRAKQLSQRFH